MRLMRTAALIGIGKKVYDEARKPENQKRIKDAVSSFQKKRQQKKH